jgi:hypothetical protein
MGHGLRVSRMVHAEKLRDFSQQTLSGSKTKSLCYPPDSPAGPNFERLLL